MTGTKPFLRWAGSKQKLLPKLISFWQPSYKRYVEPFMGSACLFFRIQPAHALLSDINCDLVDTFISVRDEAENVYGEMIKLPLGMKSYYKLRSLNPAGLTAAQRAARFIYLKRAPIYTAQSIFMIRQTLNIKSENWWSVMPRKGNMLNSLPLLEKIVKQIYSIDKMITNDLKQIDNRNFITLKYRDVCINIEAVNVQVGKFLGPKIKSRLGAKHPITHFEEKKKVSDEIYDQLENEIRKLDWSL